MVLIYQPLTSLSWIKYTFRVESQPLLHELTQTHPEIVLVHNVMIIEYTRSLSDASPF